MNLSKSNMESVDLNAIVVCIITFIVVMLIVIIAKKFFFNTNNVLKDKMDEYAINNGLELTHYESLKNSIIGLDTFERKLVYISKDLDMVVDIDDVLKCNLINKQITVQLELIYHDTFRKPLCIPFYRKSYDAAAKKGKIVNKSIFWNYTIQKMLNENDENFSLA